MYGVARVLQESGDHADSRGLLLYLGERSQELLRDDSSTSGGGSGGSCATNITSSNSPHERLLRFPLENGGRVWEAAPAGGGVSGLPAARMLPVAPAEVMWRVARASMGAKDWATAVVALRELASDLAAATAIRPKTIRPYYATFANGGDTRSASPGPGWARVARALAFCQIQQGLYRDALDTIHGVLGGGRAGGGGAEGEDAAMLMLRADALVSGDGAGVFDRVRVCGRHLLMGGRGSP